jgi:hypothetical protein
MSHKPRIDHMSHGPLPLPSPDLRERVLRLCRQEMSVRRQAVRRRASRWRWSLAGGVACLLMLNGLEERQTATRIAGITQVRSPIIVASREAHGHARLLTRATLLAALLRDPDSL